MTDREKRKLERLLKRWGVKEDELKDFLDEYDKEPEEDEEEPETEEQIEEAEADIEEKGADEQDEKDRIDESVGEQEKLDGDEDTQDAKDRVDEAEGEEKVEEEPNEEEKPIEELPVEEEAPLEEEQHEELDEEVEEAHEEKQEEQDDAQEARILALESELGNIKALFEELRQKVEGGTFGAAAQLPPQDGDDEWVGAHTRAYFNRK